MMRREMLSEYFSLGITEEGNIGSLPLLLPDYTPSLDNLPNFLMRLGPQVIAIFLYVCDLSTLKLSLLG